MIGYAIRRLLLAIPTWVFVGVMAFLIIQLTPGDPAAVMLGADISVAGIETVRQRLGLDKPLWIRLQKWLLGVFQGDLGESFFLGRPVLVAVWERLPVTFVLTVCALSIAVLFGVPLGIIAALYSNTLWDTVVMSISVVGLSVPEFVMGLGLMYVFAVILKWLPTGGYVSFFKDFPQAILHMLLPAFSLGIIQVAQIARMTRAAMLEVLNADFVQTARAKGLPEIRVIWIHALRNALLPVITIIGLAFALLMGGAFITEAVFRLPGLGSLIIPAVKRRDYPIVQGTLLIVATLVLLINLIIDFVYAYLNPKIKYA